MLAVVLVLAATLASSGTGQGQAGLQASIAEAPLAFEPDAGRTDGEVEYLAHSVAGGSLYLASREAVLSLPQGKHDSRALSLGFPGANPRAELAGLEELPGKANNFIGDDPSEWQSGIPNYGRVRYEGIYPGVDLDFYGNQRDLEYDFRLAPHADPSRIAVEMDGADSLRLTRRGDLSIEVGRTTVRQQAPVAYQEIAGERRSVPSAYERHGSTVGFRLGRYDRSRPLVIDPLVLGYSTYLGGGGDETAYGIAVDSAGAAYVTGDTASTDFPTQDPLDGDLASNDAFVTKFNPDSGGPATLAYSTYLGGSGADRGYGIAVDAVGGAHVTGVTDSTNFPTQLPYQGDQGGLDLFVTRLSPDSGGVVTLSYSTYLGGGGADGGNGAGIAVDPIGGVYVASGTFSTDYPQVDAIAGQTGDADGNPVVTKLILPFLANNLIASYSTYLGGTALDLARWNSIAVDAQGAAYVSGSTESTDFPQVDQIPGETNDGMSDSFVAKLNPDPGAAPATLAYSTYMSGSQGDFGFGIATDSAGAAYVTGSTASTDFPTQDPFQADQGAGDAYVAKLNPDAGGANPVTLAYSTYLGGAGSDNAIGIAVDSARAAYVGGSTDSTDFPTRERFQGDQPGSDAFLSKLDPDQGGSATLAYSTYLGGGDGDFATDVAVDPDRVPYLSGQGFSTNFPTQDRFQGDQAERDGFVASLLLRPADTGGAGGDADPPETMIDRGPKRKTKKRKAKFAFSSDEPGSTFFCKLDKRELAPCEASEKFKVKRKKHNLQVQGVDRAGNVDPTPAQRKWKVKRKRKRR